MGKRLTPLEWTAVEQRYRNGEPAKVLAVESGVSAHSIYRRASNEGWRTNAPPLRLSSLDRLERLAVRLETVIRAAEDAFSR